MFKVLMAGMMIGASIGLPTAASTVTVSFEGTIGYSSDVGNNLKGQSVTLSFTYDTELATRTTDASSDLIKGGSLYATTSPISATTEINGVIEYFSGSRLGAAILYDENNIFSANYFAYSDNGYSVISCYLPSGSGVPNLDVVFVMQYDIGSCYGRTLSGEYFESGFGLAEPAPIPIPAGAPMLAVGLVAIALLRHRNRSAWT